jgi:hypothetical protein
MAYSNIAQVTTANTFNMWRLVTNSLSNAVNQIAGNTTYTKDDGSWILSNGFISLSNTSGTTLTVSANATISKILTVADIVLTGRITGGLATTMYAQANMAYTVANTAYGVANSAYNTANNAANTVRVSANSLLTLSGQQLNFVNTATVTVTVTPGISGNANIAFTSVGSGGSVTSIATGLGLTGGTITTTGTISAVVASTSTQGVVKLIDNTTTTDSSNAATATAVKTAFDTAVLAYGTANNSANSVQVYANNNLILSKANLNFVNSATVFANVSSGSTGNVNVAFTINTTGITSLGTLTALDISGSAANIFDTPIVSVTANRTVTDNAAGLVLLCDSTAPTAITLTFAPASKANFAVTIIRNGTGNVIIANTSTIQKQNTTSYTTANISSQFAAATVLYTATNKFILLGDIT